MTVSDVGALNAALDAPLTLAGRAPSVVAFHGFGGTTREVELVARVAGELGLAAITRNMPGHGSHARDLQKTRFADWLGGAERAYAEAATAGPVIAAGISMGALLASELAIAHPAARWATHPLRRACRGRHLVHLAALGTSTAHARSLRRAGDPPMLLIASSTLYVLRPSWMRWVNNSVEFGFKAELDLTTP